MNLHYVVHQGVDNEFWWSSMEGWQWSKNQKHKFCGSGSKFQSTISESRQIKDFASKKIGANFVRVGQHHNRQ